MIGAAREPSRGDFFTLVCSLPALAPPHVEERPPLSRYALERKLRMLSDADREELEALEDAMFFDRLPWSLTSSDVVERFERTVTRIRSPLLQEVVRWRLGVRTMVSAIRHRAAGQEAPRGRWGVEPFLSVIRRNWTRPDFGLGPVFPWVTELTALHEAKRTRAFERLVLTKVWEELSHRAFLCPFTFEGVALYVLRWDLVHRAALEDEMEAARRFDELLKASWEGLALDL